MRNQNASTSHPKPSKPYTLAPNSPLSQEEVDMLLAKGVKNLSKEEKRLFKQATFGSNVFSIKRTLLFIVIAFGGGQGIGAIIGTIIVGFIPFMTTDDPASTSMNLPGDFGFTGVGETVMVLIAFAITFWVTVALLKPLLNTDLKHLIAGRDAIDWKLIAVAGGAYAAAYLVFVPLVSIGSLEFAAPAFGAIIGSIVFALIFIPLQTTTEEIFFRCLLARFFFHNELPRGKKIIPLVLTSGFLFIVPHLANPELIQNPNRLMALSTLVQYFGVGALLMLISLRCGSFAPALGIHAANNLLCTFAFTADVSALNMPVLFFTHLQNPVLDLLSFILIYAVTFAVVGWYRRRAKR